MKRDGENCGASQDLSFNYKVLHCISSIVTGARDLIIQSFMLNTNKNANT